MNHKIKLYLDEDVHPELSKILRETGFDTISTFEAGNCGKSDIEQIEFALTQKRVILTFNVRDFVLLYNDFYIEKREHYGIIVSAQINLRSTLKRLKKLLNHKTSEDIYNTIEFLNNWQ